MTQDNKNEGRLAGESAGRTSHLLGHTDGGTLTVTPAGRKGHKCGYHLLWHGRNVQQIGDDLWQLMVAARTMFALAKGRSIKGPFLPVEQNWTSDLYLCWLAPGEYHIVPRGPGQGEMLFATADPEPRIERAPTPTRSAGRVRLLPREQRGKG